MSCSVRHIHLQVLHISDVQYVQQLFCAVLIVQPVDAHQPLSSSSSYHLKREREKERKAMARRATTTMTTRMAVLTVGSTHFTPMVQAGLAESVLNALRDGGCTRYTVQYGRSELPMPERELRALAEERGIQLELLDFTPDIEERMVEADLVLSHAGQ